MIRILKQKAGSFVQLFLASSDEKEPFKLIPFVVMVLLMLSFIACFIYIAIISHEL